MKMQRAIILVLALALTVGAEAMLMSRLTGRGETASLPAPVAAASPSVSPDEMATPTPGISTPNVTLPGFTSPPAGRTSSSSSSNNTTSSSNSSSSSYSSDDDDYYSDDDDDDYEVPVTAPPTEPPSSGIGSILSSNSFSSNTGVGLNLNVSWQATDLGGGRARITVNGSVSSYALAVMSLPVSIDFAGYTTTVTGNSIDVSSGSDMTSSSLFSTSFDVDAGAEGDMIVTWSYRGSYSDVDLPEIVASGYVYTA